MKRNAGFTLIELMIYLMIAGVVMGAVVKLMLSQTRSYANQRGLTDVRETVRSAGALIAW
jgi:prepilin-type N-terminal cleavage/methylation domain-containing protein